MVVVDLVGEPGASPSAIFVLAATGARTVRVVPEPIQTLHNK